MLVKNIYTNIKSYQIMSHNTIVKGKYIYTMH